MATATATPTLVCLLRRVLRGTYATVLVLQTRMSRWRASDRRRRRRRWRRHTAATAGVCAAVAMSVAWDRTRAVQARTATSSAVARTRGIRGRLVCMKTLRQREEQQREQQQRKTWQGAARQRLWLGGADVVADLRQ